MESDVVAAGPARAGVVGRVPAPAFIAVGSVFHYLGPALAVLLFARVGVFGVAWLRIAVAAAVFAVWRRPWRLVARLSAAQRGTVLALGAVLAAMNTVFYLAVDRLPLATVGAIEFLGVVALAALGVRSRRNLVALALAVAGVALLTDVRLAGGALGFAFAFANCALFMLYVALGHRVAVADVARPSTWQGVDQLGAAMLVAALVALPLGLGPALPAFRHPAVLAVAVAVGVCSSVVPYVTDQLAMARLRRSTFALLLSLLPVSATVIGAVVLAQLPTGRDLAGIAAVVAAVALHQQRDPHHPSPQRKEPSCTTPASVPRD